MDFLIIKTSALGDIIQTFPVVDYLRKRFPDCQIDWIAEKSNAALVESHPEIREVIQIDTKKWRQSLFNRENLREINHIRQKLGQRKYTAVFDLQGNVKSGILLGFCRSEHKVGFGWRSVTEKPNLLFSRKRFNPPKNLNIREDYLSVVQQFFNDKLPFALGTVDLYITEKQQAKILDLAQKAEHKPKVMICPGAAWTNKQLSLDTWQSFLRQYHLSTNAFYYFVWGTAEEHALVKQLGGEYPSLIVERLELPALQNLMSKMDLVVAMDSLCLHLAGTTQALTFSVFGSSSMRKYKPEGLKHLAIQGHCPYHQSFEKRCTRLRNCTTGACMKGRKASELMEALTLWQNK